MNRPVFRRTLIGTCWLPILAMALAVSLQAWRITSRPVEFIAVGKVMVGTPRGSHFGFHVAQIEILEGSRLRANTVTRVRGSRPDLKEAEVEIRATRVKGSAILNVAAIGPDREYTQVYLDALLDEYLAMQKEMAEGSIAGMKHKVIEEVIVREKHVKEARARWEDFLKANEAVDLLAAERLRLSQLVSQLRGELEALKAAPSSTDPSAGEKVRGMESRLKDAEASQKQVLAKTTEAESLKQDYECEVQDHAAWKTKLVQFSVPPEDGPQVGILERPLGAIMARNDLLMPLVGAGVAGLLVGFILSLVVALIAGSVVPVVVRTPPPLP